MRLHVARLLVFRLPVIAPAFVLAWTLALTCTLATLAPAAAWAAPTWEQVHAAYGIARERGDAASIDAALEMADAFTAAHPQDGVALTYRGSLAAMSARVAWLPWKKLSLLNEGIRQMDEGIAMASRTVPGTPQEIDARMVHGITSARIPRTFGRGGAALGDFRFIVNSPQFPRLQPQHQATALSWLAVMLKRSGNEAESQSILQRALAIDAAIARAISQEGE